MKVITILIFFCAFLLLRPYVLQQTGLRYGGDDESYFAHSSSLVFGQFPSYEKEYFTIRKNYPLHSIGPGLMAAPFVFIFSLIDRASGSDVVYRRTLENTSQSWSLFGFVFASSFYLWLACFLLYKGLRYYFQSRHASLAVILMVLSQGIPLFVFRRPIFSHVYEFFLQSLLVFILLKASRKNSFDSRGYWVLLGIGVAIGLIFLVRLNNIVAVFVWPLVLLGNKRFDVRKACFWKRIVFTYTVSALVIIGFKVIPDFLNPRQGYNWVFGLLTQVYPPSFYVKRIFHILFGIDWGLIYTAPFILIGLVALFIFRFPLKKRLLVCLAPMAVNFYMIVMWKEQGAWYGYRYIIASIIPLLVYPLALLIQRSEKKYGKKISVVWGLIAIVPLLSMFSFEGNSTNLTLAHSWNTFGAFRWGNNTYQVEIWKMLVFHPQELFIAIFKGGLLYIVYLGAQIWDIMHMLPAIVSKKYPIFQLDIMVKTFILYAFPFVLYWVVKKGRFLNERKP
ncbi:MAG TPA: hypothetical protein ENH82_07130 [bacterium]|nr:hypothetical protein [bacterium]